MTFKTVTTIAAFTFAAVLMTSGESFGETLTLKADLSASTETPPNPSKGNGALTGNYDTATKMMMYSVTYGDLTGPATAAHFHAPAPVGKASGVEIPVKGELASPIKGMVTLTAEQEKNLMDGMTYFNLHTAANKGGEVRGQISASK